MLDPSIVLMDEPSLGLDPKSVAKVAEVIRGMAADGRSVLLVEQNVRLGMNLWRLTEWSWRAGMIRLTGDADGIAGQP